MAVLYADFGFPCCYLAGRAVDAVTEAGLEVDWRGVERDPRLSTTHRPLAEDDREVLRSEPAARELLGRDENPAAAPNTVPNTVPDTVPNTGAAVAGYAEAYGAGVAADVRRLLLEAYWVDRADIGDPEVLRRLLAGPMLRGRSSSDPAQRFGYAVSPSRTPVTTSAWRRIRAWRDEWERLGAEALPTLVDDSGTVAGAPAVLERLAKLVRDAGHLEPAELPDPARFPEVALRPAKQWVSMVGGQWAYSWMGQ